MEGGSNDADGIRRRPSKPAAPASATIEIPMAATTTATTCLQHKERTALQHVSQWLSTHGFETNGNKNATQTNHWESHCHQPGSNTTYSRTAPLSYVPDKIANNPCKVWAAFCRTPGAIHVDLFFWSCAQEHSTQTT